MLTHLKSLRARLAARVSTHLPAALVVAGGLLAGAAQAGGVQWSIGINLPVQGVVAYAQQPAVVYVPAPVYRAPPVYAAAPVYMAPRVVMMPPQRVVERPWGPPGHRQWREERRRHHHHRHQDEWGGRGY